MKSHNLKLDTTIYFIIIIFSLTLLLPTPTVCSTQCKFPAIFNFGDSNSDTGGLSAAFGQAPPPHGETFFHAPAGRYSDGRLVIDFIVMEPILPLLNQLSDLKTQPSPRVATVQYH